MSADKGVKTILLFYTRFLKIFKAFERTSRFFSSFILIVVIILIITNVLSRNIFHRSIYWSEELVSYCLVWMTYLTVGIALKRDELVGVTFGLNIFNEKQRKIIVILSLLVILWFSLYIFFSSIFLVKTFFVKEHLSGNLGVPTWVVYLSIPVGFLSLSFSTIFLIIEKIANLEVELKKV